LKEAEALLVRAHEFSTTDSKVNQYLGLCYSEQTRVANKLLEKAGPDQPQHSGSLGSKQQQNTQQIPRYNAVSFIWVVINKLDNNNIYTS
jgi:hypothetical protein